MKTIAARIALVVGLLAMTGSHGFAQTAEEWAQIKKLNWQFAGSQGNIGSEAVVQVPKGYAFLGSADASRFIELQGNPPMANHFILAPMSLKWFSAFVFENVGFVKDDEKIDPDELLETLKKSNLEDQKERRQKGLQVLVLEGWFIPPHYDVQTKRLEWGTKLRSENNGLIVNYTIKLLGRRGVMDAIVVSDPDNLDRDVNEFKSVLASYSFTSGERYTEFRTGDKVAEYGLAALIIGGAAAAAAKSGVLKGLMKFIGVGVIAVCAAGLKFVKRLFGKA